jgi:type II secretory pathway pseudopilin PulG
MIMNRKGFFQNKKINWSTIGFSFLEFIIIVGIFGILSSSFFINFRVTKQKNALDSAQASLFDALETARSRAITGVGGSNHGVYIENDKIISFEGTEYTGSGIEKDLPGSISVSYSNDTIIFSRLTGTSTDTVITLSNGAGTFNISVTEEGNITKQ